MPVRGALADIEHAGNFFMGIAFKNEKVEHCPAHGRDGLNKAGEFLYADAAECFIGGLQVDIVVGRSTFAVRQGLRFAAAIGAKMCEAGIDDYAAHPPFEWACACIAVDLGENLEEGVAEHGLGGGLIIGIAQAYLQKIAVIRSKDLFLRFAVSGPAPGDEIRRQNSFQAIKLADLLMGER